MSYQDNNKPYVRETRTTDGSGSSMALIIGGLIVAVAFILWLIFGGGAPVSTTGDGTGPAADSTTVTVEPAAPADSSTNVTIDPAPEATAPAETAPVAPAEDPAAAPAEDPAAAPAAPVEE